MLPCLGALTGSDANGYLNAAIALAYYPTPQNEQLKSWMDRFLNAFTEVEEFAMMFWVIRYRDYVQWKKFDPGWWDRLEPWYGYWHAFLHGWIAWTTTDYREPIHRYILSRGNSGTPPGPAAWVAILCETFSKLAANSNPNPDPRYILTEGIEFNSVDPIHAFQNKVLQEWRYLPNLAEKAMPMWNAQFEIVKAFAADGNLNNKDYFFLLHLLIALGAGSQEMMDYVTALTGTRTPTDAYPEETFINQLTYLVLMFLSDVREPETRYAWNNGQLQAFVRALRGVINAEKPGSAAIVKSLDLQLALLNSIASYPLFDPESALPLSERKATTRAALNKALSGLKPGA